MSADQLSSIIERIGDMQSSWQEQTTLQTLRGDLEDLYASFDGVEDSAVEAHDADGVPVERVLAPGADASRAVILFHGGGFSMGSARSHRHLAQWMSRAANCCVLVPEYRLVPDHVYPAQLEDAGVVYNWYQQRGHQAWSIGLAGDSAGGGLALALVAELCRSQQPLPACVCLMSPWLDLQCRGQSYQALEAIDPVATREMALGMGQGYVGPEGDVTDPLASPIDLDFSGFPPLLIQAGSREIFLDDARSVATAAREAGVTVELRLWQGMIHQWHLYAAELDEAQRAIEEQGAFFRQYLR